MDAVREDVEKLVTKELLDANRKFPAFRSAHEGYAVILEEVNELAYELNRIEENVKWLWRNVKLGYSDGCDCTCVDIHALAVNAAVEAIQVAAMAQKFLDSAVAEAEAEAEGDNRG